MAATCAEGGGAISIEFRHVASGEYVSFSAFLTEFTDTYTQNWTAEQVYARMDPISVYQNTGRSISIGWKVLSQSEGDAANNMEAVTKFINFQYPSYLGDHGTMIKTPPLLKMKFRNLVADGAKGLLGYINGAVSFAPNIDAGFILVGKGKLVPKEIQFSCTFTVLHTHTLGWDKELKHPDMFPYGFGEGASHRGRRKKGKGSDRGKELNEDPIDLMADVGNTSDTLSPDNEWGAGRRTKKMTDAEKFAARERAAELGAGKSQSERDAEAQQAAARVAGELDSDNIEPFHEDSSPAPPPRRRGRRPKKKKNPSGRGPLGPDI